MLYDYTSENATSSEQCSNNDCPEAIVSSDPPSGTLVNFPTYVTLTSDVEGAIIRYTIDGTVPDTLSEIYTGPILIASAGVTLRAIAHGEGCSTGSEPPLTAMFANAVFPFVFAYECDEPDHAGGWNDFTSNGINDHHWTLQFSLTGATTIKRLELFQLDVLGEWSTGQVWSTDSPINPPELGDPFDVYPLLIFIAAVQQHAAYQSSLGSFGAGSHTLDLYGDIVSLASGLFRLDIILDDDTELSQTIDATTCTVTPPLCPPPAAPTVLGKCDGAVDVTFAGTVGRPYIIYQKSDICSEEGWVEAVAGTIDVSPKTVEVSGLTQGCLYDFYVSIDEAGCGFRDSNSASATPLLDPVVTISTNKIVVNPDETFTISWTSNHIATAVCGGCLAGEVSINLGMGCKSGNVAGSQVQSQSVCGVYTYEITGCNTCGTVVASVQVEVRCPATCDGTQPPRLTLGVAATFLCDDPAACGIAFHVSQYVWDGTLYRQGETCGYASPTTGESQHFISGCVEAISTIWGGYVLDVVVSFVASGPLAAVPYWQTVINGITSAFVVKTVWIGIKTVGNTGEGLYNQVDGCAEVGQFTLLAL